MTTKPDGENAVLLSKRKSSEPFGGFWWVHGGSLGAYQSIAEFITERAKQECGVAVQLGPVIGVYRTSAANAVQSTMQPCYAAVAPYEAIVEKMRTDPNHESIRLFTESELASIPASERHWYPTRVAEIALANMP